MRAQAADVLECFLLESEPAKRVAVVEFGRYAWTRCGFTSDPNVLRRCLEMERRVSGRRLDTALDATNSLLEQAAAALPTWTYKPNELVILLPGGPADQGCAPAIAAGERLESRGAIVLAVASAPEPPSQCLKALTTTGLVFPEARDLKSVLSCPPRGNEIPPGIRKVVMTTTVSAPFEYAPLPGDNPPTRDPPFLSWSTVHVPEGGITFTYGLRPLELGDHAVADLTQARWIDTRNRGDVLVVTPPRVRVIPPAATATRAPEARRVFLPLALDRDPFVVRGISPTVQGGSMMVGLVREPDTPHIYGARGEVQSEFAMRRRHAHDQIRVPTHRPLRQGRPSHR